MSQTIEKERALKPPEPAAWPSRGETAFGSPRNFLENRFVYVVISPRARGLSLGINMNPDRRCDFDCVYCEVNRQAPVRSAQLNVKAMAHELEQTLRLAYESGLRQLPLYGHLPEELLQLRRKRFVSPYDLAMVYEALGEDSRALDCLEQAYDERAEGMMALKVDTRFKRLRDQPRYQALLRKMRFEH